ncbi:unnamed protein product, partial [Ixodes pacificus]
WLSPHAVGLSTRLTTAGASDTSSSRTIWKPSTVSVSEAAHQVVQAAECRHWSTSRRRPTAATMRRWLPPGRLSAYRWHPGRTTRLEDMSGRLLTRAFVASPSKSVNRNT